MIERRIKELSIALEALSRINGLKTHFNAVSALLLDALNEARDVPTRTGPYEPPAKSEPDDEIPF